MTTFVLFIRLLIFISLDEVNTSSVNDHLGYYRKPEEEDSDPEPSARTPMISMDSEIRTPARDGLVVQNARTYNQLFGATLVIGFTLLLFTSIWIIKYLGGVGFASPKIIFNFHPLFMVIGFILFYSNGENIFLDFFIFIQ